MTQNIAQQLEENIKAAKQIVEMYNSLERLQNNRDFKQVILRGYFQDEAVRLVHLKVDPAFQTPERQASILAQIDAIGGLVQYFRTLEFNAMTAGKAIENDQAELEEVLAEEAQNG